MQHPGPRSYARKAVEAASAFLMTLRHGQGVLAAVRRGTPTPTPEGELEGNRPLLLPGRPLPEPPPPANPVSAERKCLLFSTVVMWRPGCQTQTRPDVHGRE
jgi:hypothetical protein